jgi:hypothetical protein
MPVASSDSLLSGGATGSDTRVTCSHIHNQETFGRMQGHSGRLSFKAFGRNGVTVERTCIAAY